MKNNLIRSFVLGSGLLLGMTSGFANTVTFDFTTKWATGTTLGSVVTFSSAGQTLTTSGFWVPSTTHPAVAGVDATQQLYGKHSGTNENGLGLAIADPADHEIESTDFVQLDLNALMLAGYKNFTITLGSLQNGEGGKIVLTNSAGTMTAATLGTTLLGTSSSSSLTQSWAFTDTTKRYVDITGTGVTGGDVILATVTATTVPDGGSTAILLGAGVLCFGFFQRRRLS